MMNLFLFADGMKPVDIVFFIVCVALVALAVGIYFLIPVINKKQYQEQRENLKKREEAFKSNLSVKAQNNENKSENQQTEQDKDEN